MKDYIYLSKHKELIVSLFITLRFRPDAFLFVFNTHLQGLDAHTDITSVQTAQLNEINEFIASQVLAASTTVAISQMRYASAK